MSCWQFHTISPHIVQLNTISINKNKTLEQTISSWIWKSLPPVLKQVIIAAMESCAHYPAQCQPMVSLLSETRSLSDTWNDLNSH